MAVTMRKIVLLAALVLFPAPASAEPLLLISIDGLQPADVIEADRRGLKIPSLRRFVTEGAYSKGVVGVLPSVTYPSHTTLLTGASPETHGIVGNTTFDPMQINQGGWFWYASDIKVPTLWSAAAGAGLKVGNVHWPVSVMATGITWNLPQIWRTGHGDDAKLLAALATPGLVRQLEADTGQRYAAGIDETIEGDENRGRFAVKLMERHRPDFTTVYLTALDHEQHAEGPGTAKAHAVLERIDAVVGAVTAAFRGIHPRGTVAIVSDHGFQAIERETNLFRAFMDEGLIKLDTSGKIASWEAMPWPAGGSVAIVLNRPDDSALASRVAALLEELRRRPELGIARVADRADIDRLGANPQASFYVDMAPGTTAGGFAANAALTGKAKSKGTHGYFPQSAAMRSTFMIMGPAVARGRSLGEIDMRAIAPTLARVLGIVLPGAEKPALATAAGPRDPPAQAHSAK